MIASNSAVVGGAAFDKGGYFTSKELAEATELGKLIAEAGKAAPRAPGSPKKAARSRKSFATKRAKRSQACLPSWTG